MCHSTLSQTLALATVHPLPPPTQPLEEKGEDEGEEEEGEGEKVFSGPSIVKLPSLFGFLVSVASRYCRLKLYRLYRYCICRNRP